MRADNTVIDDPHIDYTVIDDLHIRSFLKPRIRVRGPITPGLRSIDLQVERAGEEMQPPHDPCRSAL